MKRYIGIKKVDARPMNRLDYNNLRGWDLPADENGDDEGYLVEYLDGGKANHRDFCGYISWSPADVFKRSYQPVDVAYSVTAQRIYEAYAANGPLFTGLPMAWDNLDPEIQAAWITAAKAI